VRHDRLLYVLAHTKFVVFMCSVLVPHCSLSLFPHGGPDDFASCGEDGSLRVWKGMYYVVV